MPPSRLRQPGPNTRPASPEQLCCGVLVVCLMHTNSSVRPPSLLFHRRSLLVRSRRACQLQGPPRMACRRLPRSSWSLLRPQRIARPRRAHPRRARQRIVPLPSMIGFRWLRRPVLARTYPMAVAIFLAPLALHLHVRPVRTAGSCRSFARRPAPSSGRSLLACFACSHLHSPFQLIRLLSRFARSALAANLRAGPLRVAAGRYSHVSLARTCTRPSSLFAYLAASRDQRLQLLCTLARFDRAIADGSFRM
mmetsp:Transcript_23156/g.55828  ORF Transcript_23156/g.55828 Transcript_23156/m.55828 type:complete len:251 (-) Transcript_23156:67-819(-)